MNPRHNIIYTNIELSIAELETGILQSTAYRSELNEKQEKTGTRCSDGESQQVKLNSGWDESAVEQIAFFRELLVASPKNLITQIRQRMAYLKRELREIISDETEDLWSAAFNAGREQALTEQLTFLRNLTKASTF